MTIYGAALLYVMLFFICFIDNMKVLIIFHLQENSTRYLHQINSQTYHPLQTS